MREIFERLRASHYVANVGWLVRGNLFAQLVQLAALPVISRLYTPAEFGQLTVFLAFTGFAVIGLTLRLESALLIARDREVKPLVRLSFLLLVGTAVIFSLLLWTLREYNILGHGVLPEGSAGLVAFVLLGVGAFNVGRIICLRHGEARQLAAARIWRATSNVSTKIVAGFAGLGVGGLLLGEAVGAWFASGRVRVFDLAKMVSGTVSQRRMKTLLCRYRRFVQLELPSNLIDQLAIALPVPMLVTVGGAGAAGAYGIARLVVAVPNAQIGNAVADAFQLRAGELGRQRQTGQIQGLMVRTVKTLFVLGLIPYGAIALLSPWLFPFVLGANWSLAGKMASVISIWLFAALIVGSVSRLLSVIQRQELKLYYDVTVLAAVLAVYVYARSTNWDAMQFVGAIVAVNVLAYLVYLLVLFKAASAVK